MSDREVDCRQLEVLPGALCAGQLTGCGKGYMSPEYAGSLSCFGRPRELARCGGCIIERPIPGVPDYDGMGCYPLFACRDWSQLGADLEELRGELVSVVLVTDPFGDYDPSLLEAYFDSVRPFKRHFIADLSLGVEGIAAKHHRRHARRALGDISVEVALEPVTYLDEWIQLYSNLISRHSIGGVRSFSRSSFEAQLKVPGTVMFRAIHQDCAEGALVVFIQDAVAQFHLVACSDVGYRLHAAYALFWEALDYLHDKADWANIGSMPGVGTTEISGLQQFKVGWATGLRTAYLCCKVLDLKRYAEIVEELGSPSTEYFPAYRCGEYV